MGKLDDVTEAAEQYQLARQAVDHLRDQLYATIRAAHAAGESDRAIGRAAGLSHTRIQQIVAQEG